MLIPFADAQPNNCQGPLSKTDLLPCPSIAGDSVSDEPSGREGTGIQDRLMT